MAELNAGFEDDLREAVLADAEQRLVGEEANLIFEFVELVHTRLRAYGRRNGYRVESTIESLGTPEVSRTGSGLEVAVGWESDQMLRWEFGVSPHTIEGNPVLSFVWSDPPQWVREEFDQARSDDGQFRSGWRVFLPEVQHPGIPESRAIRDALRAFVEVLRD